MWGYIILSIILAILLAGAYIYYLPYEILYFSSTSCRFCRKFKGEWQKYTNMMKNTTTSVRQIDIGSQDPKDQILIKKHRVAVVPYIIKTNGFITHIYSGNNKSNELYEWSIKK